MSFEISSMASHAFFTTLTASIPSPSQGVWHIGPLPVRAYALCILTGVFVAVWWSDRRYRARGGHKDVIIDIAIIAVPIGIVGARLYHIVTSPAQYFGENGDPTKILRVWEGGLGIWGGVLFGVIAGWVYSRRKKLDPWLIIDAVIPTILVAQAIGRFGNWFNQELFGGPTTLPWGLRIDDAHLPTGYASGTLFHPTFLYEALWNIAGALLLLALQRKGYVRRDQTLWAYLMIYTSGRLWIEMVRIDTAQTILGLRLNVWTSILVFVIGLFCFVISRMRHRHSDVGDNSMATAEIAEQTDRQVQPERHTASHREETETMPAERSHNARDVQDYDSEPGEN